MSTYQLIVEADPNDADYITSVFTEEDLDLERVKKVATVIAAKGDRHNWEDGEIASKSLKSQYKKEIAAGSITAKDLDWFNEYVPHGEYGVHTISSIKIQEVVQSTELL